jgi:hypothetical protein
MMKGDFVKVALRPNLLVPIIASQSGIPGVKTLNSNFRTNLTVLCAQASLSNSTKGGSSNLLNNSDSGETK